MISAVCRLVFAASISGDNIVASVDKIQLKFATPTNEQKHNELMEDVKNDKLIKMDDANKPIEKEQNDKPTDESNRRDKMLDYYGYYSPAPYYSPIYQPSPYYPMPVPYAQIYNPYYQPSNDEYADDYENSNNIEDDDGSRANTRRRPSTGNQNSPIFYIRLPPTPYMFVPGMGYVSQPPTIQPIAPQYAYPPPQPISPFINLPVNFVSNGKPTGVYQWQPPPPTNYANPQYPSYLPPRPQRPYRPKPSYMPDSKVTHLKGSYVFNGRPEEVYVLPNPHYHSYNPTPYSQLQNPYQPPPVPASIPQQYNGYQPIYGPPPPNYY